MLLMIDNYDSFTYNLVQYLGELGAEIEVHRNDRISVEEVQARSPSALLVSPGPCDPDKAGISVDLIKAMAGQVPVLGVCLGHQCVGQAFGARIVRADRLMHGKTSPIKHDGRYLFEGMPNPFVATRYHSLAVKRDTVPECLEITAETEAGEIMGLRHKEHPIWGVQFHPESILTEDGRELLRNFMKLG